MANFDPQSIGADSRLTTNLTSHQGKKDLLSTYTSAMDPF